MPVPFHDDNTSSIPSFNNRFPDWLIVKMAALRLMSIYGTTTAMEVEVYLKKRGYTWFFQDLNALLDMIAAGEGWTLLFNGREKVFCPGVELFESCPCHLLGFSDN